MCEVERSNIVRTDDGASVHTVGMKIDHKNQAEGMWTDWGG